jgi:hypothetical protein
MSRLLGYFSIVVHLLLGLFCLGLGLVGWLSGHDEMDITLLPVDPGMVATVLVCSGMVALAAVLMALRRSSGPRSLLVLWSFSVVAILIAAFFRSSHSFDGMEGLEMYGVFLGVAVLSLLGSWLRFRQPRRRSSY